MQSPTRLALARRISSAWVWIAIVIWIGQGCSTVLVPEKSPVEELQAITPPIEAQSPTSARASPKTPPPEAEASAPPKEFVATGLASWYGANHHGTRTASGEIFNQPKFT